MPGKTSHSPNINTFLEALKDSTAERSIELLTELLSRRQIKGSKDCALATTQLLDLVVQDYNAKDVNNLLIHVRYVGQRLMAAQPRELAVGNIVRRVLGLIREVSNGSEEDDDVARSEWSSTVDPQEDHTRPPLLSTISMFSPLKHGATEPVDVIMSAEAQDVPPPVRPQRPQFAQTSMYSSFAVASTRSATNLFGFFGEGHSPRFSPQSSSPVPATSSPNRGASPTLSKANLMHQANQLLSKIEESHQAHSLKDIKLDIAEGMKEMRDELELASEQISEFALNYINANDVILAQGSSETIQNFLAAAASKKRKFTVFCVEGEPNGSEATRRMILTGSKTKAEVDEDEDLKVPVDYKPLIAMGVNVVLVPDSAVFAIMSSVNKVLLAPHTVLANGGLLANAGACAIAAAATAHKVPVLALSGVYKLSPLYPLDTDELREIGGAGPIAGMDGGWDGVDIMNPMWDYVAPDKVHLYITNLGGHAPSYLYRIVADHYDREDIALGINTQ